MSCSTRWRPLVHLEQLDSSLTAHQRMSAYSVDMDVDVKMNGKWSAELRTQLKSMNHQLPSYACSLTFFLFVVSGFRW